MAKKLNAGTVCVQGGWKPGNGEARVLPIYQSTTFKYSTSEQMARLFDLEENGYFYTRLANPTNDAVAAKIAELEGGVAAILTSSGQAANFYAVFNLCESGDHFVCSSAIYGGTFNLFAVTMKKMGIDCTFVSPDSTEEEIAALGVEKREVVVGYNLGDSVKITDGALESFLGTVEEIDLERGKVSVKVSMFGRDTPVELELDQIERID